MNQKSSTKNFPKLTALSQFNKLESKLIDSRVSKWLKPFVSRRDIILGNNIIALNVACWVNNKSFDKSKIIKILRESYDLNPNICFYGWCGLAINLGMQYGSKDFQIKTSELMGFVKKHVEAYHLAKFEEVIEFKPKEFPEELADLRIDSLICKDKSGESCYIKMWEYADDSYYIYDSFLDDMMSFGYTKDQLKVIIHGRYLSGGYDYIPNFLVKKYMTIPDGSKSIKTILFE